MTIYGVSQSSGLERRLKIEKGIDGIYLTIVDHVGRKEQGRIGLVADSLVGAIIDAPAGGSVVEGLPTAQGRLNVEVRRNEVWLTISDASSDGADIAVGFDDLQDALEGVISKA